MNLKHCTGEELFALNCCQQRGDLWTLNYTKTVFGMGELTEFPDLSLMGIHPPHSLPLDHSDVMTFCLVGQGASFSSWIGTPTFLTRHRKVLLQWVLLNFAMFVTVWQWCFMLWFLNVKVMIKISKLNENLSLDYSVLVCSHYNWSTLFPVQVERKKYTTNRPTYYIQYIGLNNTKNNNNRYELVKFILN